MANDTKSKFSILTVSLHWFIAFIVINLIAMGKYMVEQQNFNLFEVHKSIGLIVFVFILIRAIWRLKNGWPEPVTVYQAWEHKLARIVHWVLIIATIAMPISGMMMAGGAGYGFGIFGWQIMPIYPDPNDPYNMLMVNETVYRIGHTAHIALGNILAIAVLLHILGAFKHHFIDKDATLRRMLGRTIK